MTLLNVEPRESDEANQNVRREELFNTNRFSTQITIIFEKQALLTAERGGLGWFPGPSTDTYKLIDEKIFIDFKPAE